MNISSIDPSPMMRKNCRLIPKKILYILLAVGIIIAGTIFIYTVRQYPITSPLLCSPAAAATTTTVSTPTSLLQLNAIVHYATTKQVPQQTIQEITVTFNVLKSRSPCNFLVFGLGRDSLMWASLNPQGTTFFLEEDPNWITTVLKQEPGLNAHAVKYRTRQRDAAKLLRSYPQETDCSPSRAFLRGNKKCILALESLPVEVYEREWDLIMVDAPRGYFLDAPGRMAAIYSAAVMARGRKGGGTTHVFVHDVDRKVEREFSEEFLCRKYLVEEVGRLWHFEIPPVMEVGLSSDGDGFC